MQKDKVKKVVLLFAVICYDPKTMVCYLKILESSRMGLSPYYVIGEDGKPEIAVYGVNYN